MDNIIKLSKEIQNSDIVNKEEHFSKIYPSFKETHPILFSMSCKQNIDKNMFEYIVSMVTKIKDNKIKNEDATIEVGQKLFDKYVKPLVVSEKNLNSS
jgi:hypothetical protein